MLTIFEISRLFFEILITSLSDVNTSPESMNPDFFFTILSFCDKNSGFVNSEFVLAPEDLYDLIYSDVIATSDTSLERIRTHRLQQNKYHDCKYLIPSQELSLV